MSHLVFISAISAASILVIGTYPPSLRIYRFVEGAAAMPTALPTSCRAEAGISSTIFMFQISEPAVDLNFHTAFPNLASRHLSFDVNDNQFKTCASTDANLLQFVPTASLLHFECGAAKSTAFSSPQNLASSGQRLKETLEFLVFNGKFSSCRAAAAPIALPHAQSMSESKP